MVYVNRTNFFRKNFGRIKGTLLFAIILLPSIVQAQPAYDNRYTKQIRVSKEGGLPEFERINNITPLELNEELLGTVKQRQKRLSDQRRAELETLMALSKMTGKLVAVPRGGRQLDTAKIGRRRRSISEFNARNLRKLFRLSGISNHKGNAAYPVVS